MSKKIKIFIPTACHENWEAMSPTDKGRFCGSCQKKVYDFTASSDKLIVNVLNREPNACGRFTINQLNRDLAIPKQKSTIWMAASAAIAGFLTLGTTTAIAQTPVPTEQREPRPNYMLGKYIAQPTTVSGKVTDATGDLLPYVNVVVKGTQTGAITDEDGNFSINATRGNILIFSYVGFENQEITVANSQNLTIVLKEGSTALMGDIVVVKKRTFAGRILHSIGNLFR